MNVFYKVVQSQPSHYRVKFWTKDDASNAITETFVTLDETRLKNRIENVLGHKNVNLVRVTK